MNQKLAWSVSATIDGSKTSATEAGRAEVLSGLITCLISIKLSINIAQVTVILKGDQLLLITEQVRKKPKTNNIQ